MMLVAMFGLIPASLATGIGSDVQRPLATVIVGGLASALVMTLVVVPSLYYLVESRTHKSEIETAIDIEELETKIHEDEIKEEHKRHLKQ